MTVTINLDRKFYSLDSTGNTISKPLTVDDVHGWFKRKFLTKDTLLVDAESGVKIKVGDIKEIFPDG